MQSNNVRSRTKPRWAPRVPQHKIQRLYEGIANGRVDDELLDDVGFTLYLRCKSILAIRDIFVSKRLPCPRCGRVIALDPGSWSLEQVPYPVECPDCRWSMHWGDYWATFRHQELGPGGDGDLFESFMRSWEAARSTVEKVIAVDRIIHQWHWETASAQPSFGVGRPTGVNLIEGNRKDVIAFLDHLTYGASTPADVSASRDAWRQRLGEVRAKQEQFRQRHGHEA